MAKDHTQSPHPVRRTGGQYSLSNGFALLDISPSHGFALIKEGKIRVIRPFGPNTAPKITDLEIARILGEAVSRPRDETA
jgi:hypothetical protein